MIHVGICDDNPVILKTYWDIITNIVYEEKMQVTIHTFSSGEELIFELSEEVNRLDILYLDILMGKMNGIETAKKLRAMGSNTEIIYLTSSEEYVFESFDTTPLHYILKEDITNDKFKEILMRAIKKKEQKNNDVFICEAGNVIKKINLDDIFYFEVRNRIVTVYYKEGTFDFYSSMENVEERIHKKGFVRTHRSFIINMKYIDQILKNVILLTNEEEVPIGNTYTKNVKKAFSDYLIEGI